MVELAQSDPEYASKLVKELMDTKAENELLKEAVDALRQREQEAQQALRQARGISTYLKGKQEDLQKDDVKGKLALRQANGISLYLRNKNEELKNKLQDAERVEIEAQLALRQAKGVSAYLQKKNVSLEKKVRFHSKNGPKWSRWVQRMACSYSFSLCKMPAPCCQDGGCCQKGLLESSRYQCGVAYFPFVGRPESH